MTPLALLSSNAILMEMIRLTHKHLLHLCSKTEHAPPSYRGEALWITITVHKDEFAMPMQSFSERLLLPASRAMTHTLMAAKLPVLYTAPWMPGNAVVQECSNDNDLGLSMALGRSPVGGFAGESILVFGLTYRSTK